MYSIQNCREFQRLLVCAPTYLMFCFVPIYVVLNLDILVASEPGWSGMMRGDVWGFKSPLIEQIVR